MGTVTPPGEQQRTLAAADVALAKIRQLGQAGDPRTYAAWFTYATNSCPSQNLVVNGRVAVEGGISVEELEKIYGRPAAGLTADKLGHLAAALVDEVSHAHDMLDRAISSIGAYRDDLANLAELKGPRSRQGLSAMVERLTRASKAMEAKNGTLIASLQSVKQQIAELHEKAVSLRGEELTDRLTSLANRVSFDRELDRYVVAADAAKEPLCLLIIDIDHLDKVNDRFGHLAGDQVLRVVAHSLRQHVASSGLAARIGGEEFAVVLPKTALSPAVTVGDHIRCRVMATQIMKRSTGESIGRVSISAGIAALRRGEGSWDLLRRADGHLGAAKRHGCNRVVSDADATSGAG